MSVPFGFVAGTRVATPTGPVAIEQLAVGDAVWTWDPDASDVVPSEVTAVHTERVQHLVGIDAEPRLVQGCTPGTAFYDAFEGIVRSAASLSVLSELITWGAEEGAGSVRVLEVPERTVDPTDVFLITVKARAGLFFADGVLARHREVS